MPARVQGPHPVLAASGSSGVRAWSMPAHGADGASAARGERAPARVVGCWGLEPGPGAGLGIARQGAPMAPEVVPSGGQRAEEQL